jgi:hypothetical protein
MTINVVFVVALASFYDGGMDAQGHSMSSSEKLVFVVLLLLLLLLLPPRA